MKKLFFLLMVGCCLVQAPYAQQNSNAAFDAFKDRFINAFWQMNPEFATNEGYHAYDSLLTVNDVGSINRQEAFCFRYLDSLKKFPYDKLNDDNKIDEKLIENQLRSTYWQYTAAKEYVWNPAAYNVAGSFAVILGEPFDKLEHRLTSLAAKLLLVPDYYAAAMANIRQPAEALTQLAIEQNTGGLSVLEKELPDSVKASSLEPQLQDTLRQRTARAVAAIKSYIVWLQALPAVGGRSFRLGEALYAQQFDYDIQSSYTVDALYLAAQQRKAYLLNQMQQKAKLLWPKYFGKAGMPADRLILIRKLIDTISTQHVTPAAFQASIEAQLPALAAFVQQKDLLNLDPSKPLKVRLEPGYMAGVAGASISAPGPYDKNANTYYNVGSLQGWSAEKAESYLREYNNYTLQILNMHEGIPGHYVQLLHSNQSSGIIKSVFGNGSMIEGWAVYSELLMMENGYNNSPEMWLMYYKWNLRSVCNTILDIGVHTRNMSEKEAMDLLVNQAFQQQAEAEGKWKRVSVTHVQLTSYFNGFYEIIQLREAYKKKLGSAYTVKKFNEKFLSYGSAPVKYIRQLMLGSQ